MGIVTYENSKVRLTNVIAASDLDEGQKEIWYDFIRQVTELEAVAVLQAVENDQEHLGFLTQNLEEKMQSLKAGDRSAWEEIVLQEKEYLAGVQG